MKTSHTAIFFVLLFAAGDSAAAGDGALDADFAGNGKAVVGFTANSAAVDATAQAMVVQPDGKILLAGYSSSNGVGSTALARLNTDGALDTTFGNGGRISGLFLKVAGTSDVASAVALQPDGKILLFGFLSNDAYVVRLTATGQKDTSFGNGGAVLYPGTNQGTTKFNAGAITRTGSVLASGSYDDGSGAGATLINVLFDASGNVAAAQNISSVPSLDGGALVMQPDGKAVIAVTSANDCAIVRDDVGASLSLDAGFGTGGIARFGWNLGGNNLDFCFAVALQRDGKILMGGETQSDSSGDTRATVLRLLPNGTLDAAFGKKDFAFASATPGPASIVTAILVQQDQRIVLTGMADTTDPAHAPQDFAALRLLPDGSLDATFTAPTADSSLGKVVFGFETGGSGRRDAGLAAGLQGNRIVIAGVRETSNSAMTAQFAIARLQNDGLFADGFELH